MFVQCLMINTDSFCPLGLPQPKLSPIFDGLNIHSGFYTSKDFLPIVSTASKAGKLRTCTSSCACILLLQMMQAQTQARQAVLNHVCITVVCTLGFLCSVSFLCSLSLHHLFRQALKMIIKHYKLVCNLPLKFMTPQVCLRIKQERITCNKRCLRLFSILDYSYFSTDF